MKAGMLIALLSCASCLAQQAHDAVCHGPTEHQVCEFGNGDVIESTLAPDGTYTQRHYNKGKVLDLGEKKAWDDIIAREDTGEKKARHELCLAGTIKGYRCHDVPGIPVAAEKPAPPDDHHDCFMAADPQNMQRCNDEPEYRKKTAEKYRADKAAKAAATAKP
jgi:hypothetical protein